MAVGDASLVREPALIESLDGIAITRVAAGLVHSVFLSANGAVYTCGSNGHGQLGHENVALGEDLTLPMRVDALADRCIVQVACGSFHTFMLDSTGRVFVCGGGERGVLGVGDVPHCRTPREVLVPSGARVVHMAAGHDVSVLIDARGMAYYMGRRLDGSDYRALTPMPLATQAQVGRVHQAAVGNSHVVLETDRGVFALGANTRGQLGRPVDPLPSARATPVNLKPPHESYADIEV